MVHLLEDTAKAAFRSLWLLENKPFGLEVQEARFGSLLLRLRSCRERILAYLDGRIEAIDELEAEQLPFRPENAGHALRYNNFAGSYIACVP